MIIVLLLCILLTLVLGAFVVAPIAVTGRDAASSAILKGFADEDELRQALHLRDVLLLRLTQGEAGEPTVDALSETDALEALLGVCERLRNAELPYLPAAMGTGLAKGSLAAGGAGTVLSSLLVAGLVGTLALGGACFLPSRALAQIGEGNAQNARIPGPTAIGDVLFPVLHQFVLSPREGKLHVYYLGVFNNEAGLSEAKIALPFPKGFSELRVANRTDAVFEASTSAYPVLRTPLKAGVNEVRAEFELDAAWGTATWKADAMPELPGTFLVLMPEYQSPLRTLTESAFPSLNVWPPRVVDVPSDFRSVRTQEEYNPADPNYEMLLKLPAEYTRNLVRSGPEAKPYPTFRVVGLVPSRVPLYVLAGLFGSFLLAFALSAMFRATRTRGAGGTGTGTLSNA